MNEQLERALSAYLDLRRLQRQTEQARHIAELLSDRASFQWSLEIAAQEARHRDFLENKTQIR
jgi:hypothetical protein